MNRKRVFRSERNCLFVVVLIVMCFIFPQWCHAQIEMNVTGSYVQNFNSLSPSGSANNWMDNQTLPGWYWQCGTAFVLSPYLSDDGTSDEYGRRCYGSTGDPDRAIGGFNKVGVSAFVYGLQLHNTSNKTITDVSVAYTGEQWKVGSENNQQKIAFYYRITTNPGINFTSIILIIGKQ